MHNCVAQPNPGLAAAWDTYQIKNVIGRLAYYRMQGLCQRALEELFSERPDISWGTSAGYYTGKDSVLNYLNAAAADGGYRFDHYYSSYLIEVAGDGESAKGLFYSPGTAESGNGAFWAYERCAVDFIVEDGQWRVWHFCAFSDFTTPIGEAYSGDKELGRTFPKPDIPMTEEAAGLITTEYGYALYPQPPVPYESFKETFSYGPEGLALEGGISNDK